MAAWRVGLLAALLTIGMTARVRVQSPPPPPPPVSYDNPILCEFRVFNGERDVTPEAFLRIYASGSRDDELTVEPLDGRLRIALPTGLYDIETFGRKEGSIVTVKWTERIVVTHYPDEPDGHLEVINFRPRFGAVLFVSDHGDAVRDLEIQVFPAGTTTGTSGTSTDRAASREADSPPYQLFVLPSGRYDVRVRRRGSPPDSEGGDERWLRGVQIAINRTQLTSIY